MMRTRPTRPACRPRRVAAPALAGAALQHCHRPPAGPIAARAPAMPRRRERPPPRPPRRMAGAPAAPPPDRPDLPTLAAADYYTRPSLAELAALPPAELAAVPAFTVGRSGVGEVTWTHPVDVRGVDLTAAIELAPRQVSMDGGAAGAAALNAPATVRLVGVWRRDKATGAPRRGAAADAAMRRKLRAHCDAAGLTWGGYDGDGGVWQFGVDGFL